MAAMREGFSAGYNPTGVSTERGGTHVQSPVKRQHAFDHRLKHPHNKCGTVRLETVSQIAVGVAEDLAMEKKECLSSITFEHRSSTFDVDMF
jgi:hypothetical protein